MRLLAGLLILVLLPLAHAQEGLFVQVHNVTYELGTSDFSVEEVIVFENTGPASGNLFNENIYLTRGNAKDVEVETEGGLKYSVEYLDSTIINVNLVFWRGEKRAVTLRYNRSDMLFTEDNVHFFSGLALGKYSWIADSATVKFTIPAGSQFGPIVPPAPKTIEGKKETATYSATPTNLENLNAIKDGIPVFLEYAKYDELAVNEMKTAKEFIEDAESSVSSANKSIENALETVSDTTQILTLFEIANTKLDESKNSLVLAEIKSNTHSEEYSPYEAYYYAKQSRNLSRESSRKAGEAKDLANYQVQLALEDKISGIGSILKGQADEEELPPPGSQQETQGTIATIWSKGLGIAFIVLLAAVVIFDIYRRSGGSKTLPARKKSQVDEFKAIDALKRKSFKGFDKKLDSVKHGTGLATQIRDLRKKREELEFARESLQRKKERDEIEGERFEMENERLKRDISETSLRIDELKSRLRELKRANR
jgi:hypothetical protein